MCQDDRFHSFNKHIPSTIFSLKKRERKMEGACSVVLCVGKQKKIYIKFSILIIIFEVPF